MPRIALLSDIHANISALEKTIKKLEDEKPDLWVCLGDFVGYGPKPSEVIDLVRDKEMICVKGNHDAGVTGELTLKHFRKPNQTLIQKTRELITFEQLDWLKSLPYKIENDFFLAAHASPIEPENWKYVESAFVARQILGASKKDLVFVGHTHKPVLVSQEFGMKNFGPGNKFLINPGSVGQSRDGDYRASCAIVDTDKWEYLNIRVEFQVEPVLTSLMKLGFSRDESKMLMKV